MPDEVGEGVFVVTAYELRETVTSISPSKAGKPMSKQKFPAGWNEDRVRKLIAHYEQLDENEQVADDEAATEAEGQTLMMVPNELVPTVRELIAHKHVE